MKDDEGIETEEQTPVAFVQVSHLLKSNSQEDVAKLIQGPSQRSQTKKEAENQEVNKDPFEKEEDPFDEDDDPFQSQGSEEIQKEAEVEALAIREVFCSKEKPQLPSTFNPAPQVLVKKRLPHELKNKDESPRKRPRRAVTLKNRGASKRTYVSQIVVGSETYKIGDCVLISAERHGDAPWIARIEKLWNQSTQPWFEGIWFYRASDTATGRKVDGREVFLSNHSDMNPLAVVEGRCTVTLRSEIEELRAYKKLSPHHYHYSESFDTTSRRFTLIDTPKKKADTEEEGETS